MLVPENERYTASQVFDHPWFNNIKEKLEKLNFNSKFFKEYNDLNKLQKIVLLFISSRLSENEINDLKEIFKAFDENHDGQIGFNEFEQGLNKLKAGETDKINSYLWKN